MSLFLRIPSIDPEQYECKYIALAAWKALQAIDKTDLLDCWKPRISAENKWQVDKANSWQVLQHPKGFELFSYYGEDIKAANIIDLIPSFLEEVAIIAKKEKAHAEWCRRYPYWGIPNRSGSIIQY